jgi:excisionase family DNA binding protein
MEEIFTVEQVARSYEVTSPTVREWYQKKILPHQEIGRTIRIRQNDFAAMEVEYVKAQTRQTKLNT